ncbi:MAG: phage major capsid protein, partial [Candidatus Methylomirabilales bacterium]
MQDVNKELRESRLNLWSEMQDVLNATAATGMSGEESEKYGRMETDFLRLTQDLEARDRAALHQEKLDKPQDIPPGTHDIRTTTPYLEEQRAYERAFNKWLRGNADALTMEERAVLHGGRIEFRDQSVGVGSAGGFLVPEAFANKIFEHRKWFGSMRQVAGSMMTATGADLMFPNVDDTGNVGAILAENAAISEQDVAFGSRTYKAWMYTSKLVQVSWQLMQDSFFDLDTFLARVLGERLGRIENTHFTNGVGATQPEGWVPNATTVATDTNDVLVLKDVVKLIYNVDRAYR